MTNDERKQPAPGGTDDVPVTDGAPGPEFDTEGHSLLDIELARTINQDRVRDVARLDRDAARARQAHGKESGGILKRFGRGRS